MVSVWFRTLGLSGFGNGLSRSLTCVSVELFSRAVSRKVFSPLQSLTSVFGMGTGGPSALKKPTRQRFSVDLFDCVSADLSSRAVASQVFSALQSLTSVFGMGTGGPSAFVTLTSFQRKISFSLNIEQQYLTKLLSSRLFFSQTSQRRISSRCTFSIERR